MSIRPYNAERDWHALVRIWHEVGWSEPDDDRHDKALRLLSEETRLQGIEVYGELEAITMNGAGQLRYLEETLPLHATLAVCTSRVARKQGFAGRLTAEGVAHAALEEGALVSALGFFEQGFYDQVGFGTMAPMIEYRFDPARLKPQTRHRPPRRIPLEEYVQIHEACCNRMKFHGAVDVHTKANTYYDLAYFKNGSTLGYFDGPGGTLSHFIFLCTKDGLEYGPYTVERMVFQNVQQAQELIALLHSFADQIRALTLIEPEGLCVQDLLDRPFQAVTIGEEGGSELNARITAAAWQALRINDLVKCLEHTHLPGPSVQFNLVLTDPIERYLESDAPWRGIGGEYRVTLGPESSASPGINPTLPTLHADVPGFSRLWLGVHPARTLSASGAITGPPELLAQLEKSLCIPQPKFGWKF